MRNARNGLIVILSLVALPSCNGFDFNYQSPTACDFSVAASGAPVALRYHPGSTKDLAQSILPQTGITAPSVDLLLTSVLGVVDGKKEASVSGTLTATIETGSSSQPSGTVINSGKASGSIAAGLVSEGVNRFYRFEFSEPVALSPGVRYWVRLSASYSPTSETYVQWVGSSGNLYSLGEARSSNLSDIWSALSSGMQDFSFRLGCE